MTIRSLVLVLALLGTRACAAEFAPSLDPGSVRAFSHWDTLSMRSAPGKIALLDERGHLTVVGHYLDALARDPAALRTHLQFVFSDASGNWEQINAPRFRGPAMKDQSCVHRMLRAVGRYTKLMREAVDGPSSLKEGLMTDAWRDAAEAAFGELVNDDGLLARGPNVCDMAQCFHLLRTGLESARLRPEQIWTLPRAQRLVRTVLTAPEIFSPDDVWLPASDAYLAQCRTQNAKTPEDPVRIDGNKVLFTGGLFIGWKAMRPSLHATWDALAILNTLETCYPEPDATKSGSVFFRWSQQPAEAKASVRRAMQTLRTRLWDDWRTKQGATYCYVADGRPVDTTKTPTARSSAPRIVDHAGYDIAEMWHWAAECHAEMFASPRAPSRNSNAGVARLFALVGLPAPSAD